MKELKFLERVDEDHALLQLTCGKGGYVRSIARDLGKDLKCFAHVKWLKRIWSGPFELKTLFHFKILTKYESYLR